MFRPIHAERMAWTAGYRCSPLLAHDTERTLASARSLHQRCGELNLLIKIPGTKEGLPAIEAAISAGILAGAVHGGGRGTNALIRRYRKLKGLA